MMKKSVWRKNHKWAGLILALFLIFACISGLVLNHRHAYANVNVSRVWLPSSYHFNDWNNGMLRGSLRMDSAEYFLYGVAGIFRMSGDSVTMFNSGLPDGADFRQIKSMARVGDGKVFAAAQYGLYALDGEKWHEMPITLDKEERLTDAFALGDTLMVMTRNRILCSLPPYDTFNQVDLKAPDGYDGRVSLFRVMWLVHSGEMFGLPGKILIDIVSIAMILISITGIVLWAVPKYIRRHKGGTLPVQSLRISHKVHNKVGVWGIALLLFVVVTGWMLRPPLLIPLVLNDMPGIEGTKISPSHPWRDKLRMIRYSNARNEWLISTSDGFFAADKDFSNPPSKIENAPQVSVMGVNVMEQVADDEWLVGSFSGLYRWNRKLGAIVNWHTGERASDKAGPPFGSHPVCGYANLDGTEIVVDYYKGTDLLDQPSEFRYLPMSMWNLALEVHTGRIYGIFGLAPLLWVFVLGAAAIWAIWSGWKCRSKN